MLYVFLGDNCVTVSNINPDSDEALKDWESCLKESFDITFPPNHKTPLSVEAGVIRNKLVNGGAEVTLIL